VNFEDERYVRVYTRKTVTMKLLGWEGRMCLHALLLEVDRAGVLELEGMDPAEALAAMADLPIEHARVGMARLIERGVVTVRDGILLLPRFIEAQEAKQTDAQRQRESRANRAARLRISEHAARVVPPDVTNRDHKRSHDVTSGHTESHAVTVGHSVLSSAQLSSAQQGDLTPTPVVAPKVQESPPVSAIQPAIPADHVRLQRHYAAAFRRETGADHVLARGQGSRHGRALQDLLEACKGDLGEACGVIDRALADPWQRGKRPELWNIVADVNKFRGNPAPSSPRNQAPGSGQNFAFLKARAERIEREEREEQEARNAAR
jgi:hypothetical protein